MKVVVVGGGTAGWISALILKKETDHDITLIDNSSVGPLGVGEGTTGLFVNIVKKYFDEEEFVRECGATPKMGIDFIGWAEDDFVSPLNGTFSCDEEYDYAFFSGINSGKLNSYSTFSLLSENNKVSYKKGTTKNSFITPGVNAYHLDTHKTIAYLKKFCVDIGVEFIDSEIISFDKSFFGKVKTINCSDNLNIECDFVVDCSGFHRKVISEYKPKFISYEKWMSVNTALSFRLSYNSFKFTKPVTISRALSCGWMWMIPTQKSIGCGIVYDNKFASEEDVISEVSKLLNNEIEINRKINFKTGRLKKSLYQNVASVGTSYSFLEPLQATSIHTTILQATRISELLKNLITPNEYNEYCASIVDNYADFLSLHYQFKYIDNKFWNSRVPRKYTQKIINKCKSSNVIFASDYNTKNKDFTSHNLWSYVLSGGRLLTKDDDDFSKKEISTIKTWEKNIPFVLSQYMTFDEFRKMYN